MLNRILKVAVWNVLVILALLACCEFALRQFNVVPSTIVRAKYYSNLPGDFEPGIRMVDKRIPEKPYVFSTNAQGLRSLQEISPQKPQDTLRILCLGDSFTMGWGVNDEFTYPEQLRQAVLRNNPGVKLEVINAGNTFNNILDQLDYFNDKGAQLQPDLVIVQFYANDIYNEMARRHVDRIYNKKQSGPYVWTLSGWFFEQLEKTSLYNLAAKLAFNYVPGRKAAAVNASADATTMNTDETTLTGLLVNNVPDEAMASDWGVLMDESKLGVNRVLWNNYAIALLSLKHKLDALNIPLLFIIIPTQFQIDQKLNAPACFFSTVLQENDISGIDFTEIFRKHSFEDYNQFYIAGDGHTNERGNVLLAATIAEHLTIGNENGQQMFGIRSDFSFRSCAERYRVGVHLSEGTFTLIDQSGIVKSFSVTESGLQHDLFNELKTSGFEFRGRDTGSGELTMAFELQSPIKHADAQYTLFGSFPAGGLSSAKISSSVDGSTYSHVSSDTGSGGEDWRFKRRVLDFPRLEDTSKLFIKFEFVHRVGLLFPTVAGKDEYMFTFDLYK